MSFRYTEQILNSSDWVDGQGNIYQVQDLDKDHLHNILNFIYKRRNRYWLNCRKTEVIESFKDGDEFFQKVIRTSTLWLSIMNQLDVSDSEFNFAWKMGSRYDG
ncbi:hypothetical protein PTW40_14385 [Lactiplantibacillus plantarum]|uniref:hypothetical protein n=1 Tax=Lactiplantibacillus plantarum TaxID=1590 RepID=UPI00237933F2|nr:hypothetical protein [Lactiplantibacillus plantarum]WDQ20889.1 hypothetical protein PTW40_14385 [Lactiplantibacillus plantarum]